MEITEAELDALIDRKLSEKKKANARNPKWYELKEEISDYVDKRASKNKSATKAWALRDAINGIIRFKVDCRNVSSMNDEQVEEARRIFQLLKSNI